jgi:uncharacterized protein YidB (DUF937 family)
MARGMPSMLALLGLLAVAGYQNRDKIGEMLNSAGAGGTPRDGSLPPGQSQGGLDSLLSGLGGLLGGGATGSTVTGGLGDLLDRFKQNGDGEAADSWVSTGPNQGLRADQVEQAIGADNITELSKRTGLSREELLERLATAIPEGVDKLTPEGRLPTEQEASRLL